MTVAVSRIENTTKAVGSVNPFSAATFADWIVYCDVQKPTQVTYDKAVCNFAGYLKANGISEPTRQDVISYREWLLASGYKVSSARLYLVIVKKFFKWLASKLIYPNVADGVKLPAMPTDEHAHDALTLAEAKQAISFFEGSKDEKTLRDKCIMSLMICAGLRSIEVVRLDVGDIEKRRGQWFIRVHGKARAGKTDSVALSDDLKRLIDEYLSTRKNVKKNSPLFVSTSNRCRGARLETQTVSRLAKRVFVKIGIISERITCHSCRSTFATVALSAGVPIRNVQKILRHRRSDTTEIYAMDLNVFNNRGVQTVSDLLFSKE